MLEEQLSKADEEAKKTLSTRKLAMRDRIKSRLDDKKSQISSNGKSSMMTRKNSDMSGISQKSSQPSTVQPKSMSQMIQKMLDEDKQEED